LQYGFEIRKGLQVIDVNSACEFSPQLHPSLSFYLGFPPSLIIPFKLKLVLNFITSENHRSTVISLVWKFQWPKTLWEGKEHGQEANTTEKGVFRL
jgi:hypothetical protein